MSVLAKTLVALSGPEVARNIMTDRKPGVYTRKYSVWSRNYFYRQQNSI
jgi:hypothetical protein